VADKLTGKASYIVFDGVSLYITKYAPKVTRTLADTTDSANYSASSDMISPSQIPVMAAMELDIEGYYHKSQTGQLLALAFTGANELPTTLGLDAGTLYGHGNFDLSDFASEIPLTDTVRYTASIKQNGTFTPNS
jgi:hypothetical protein